MSCIDEQFLEDFSHPLPLLMAIQLQCLRLEAPGLTVLDLDKMQMCVRGAFIHQSQINRTLSLTSQLMAAVHPF